MHDAPHIHFVLESGATRWPDIDALDERDIERQPQRFVGGRNSWIAQSFLRLKPFLESRGWRASAGPGFAPGGISVVHRDDLNRFRSDAHRSYLVAVRADRAPVAACDIAIAQNALRPARGEHFIPLWPQPGLVPRDAERGARIEHVAYQGRTGTSPSWFSSDAFLRQLSRRNIWFEARESGWGEYRDVDVALAIRDELPGVLATKPATKIYNGWLSRVAVLAAPEPAYQEVRRAPLDFLEVRGPDDVLNSIDLLRANPSLYQAMVANGVVRSREYSVDAIRSRWLDFFDDEVVPGFHRARPRLDSRRRWFLGAMARQKVASRVHRIRLAFEHRAGLELAISR